MLSKTTVHELARQAEAAQKQTANTKRRHPVKLFSRSRTVIPFVPNRVRLQVLSDSWWHGRGNVVVAVLLMSF